MRIVEEGRPIIVEEPQPRVGVDRVELGIADHADLVGRRHAAGDKLPRRLVAAHKDAVETGLGGMEGDRAIARAMRHMDETRGGAERGLSAAQAQAGALGADQYVAVQQGARVIVEIGEPFHRRDAIGQAQQPVGPGGKADVQPSDPRDARLVKQCLQAAADRPRARGAAYVDLRRLRRHGPDDARQMRDLMRRIVIEQKQDSGWKHPSGTGPASLIERTA